MRFARRWMPIALFPLLSCMVHAAEKPAPKARGLTRSLVVGKQGYFPVALRLQDGRIAVVLRGGAGHLGIQGRLDMVFSGDDGRTWTPPTVVVDSPVDDRNPALGQARDGTLVVGFCAQPAMTARGNTPLTLTSPLGPGPPARATAARPGANPPRSTWRSSVGGAPSARS